MEQLIFPINNLVSQSVIIFVKKMGFQIDEIIILKSYIMYQLSPWICKGIVTWVHMIKKKKKHS